MTDETDAVLEGELSTVMAGSDPLGNLKALHMGGATYRVLSARNGSATLYRVNLGEPECNCPDFEYNQDGQDVCAHVVKAALAHPGQLDVETQAAWTLMSKADSLDDMMNRARDQVSQLEQSLVSMRDLEAGAEASAASADPEPDQSQPSSPEPDVNAEQAVRDWLDENYMKPQLVQTELGPHGSDDGVRLEPDNQTMTDAQYEQFKSLMGTVDASTVHVGFTDDGCQNCNSGEDGFFYHIPTSAVRGL
jgi:hypothetical protein